MQCINCTQVWILLLLMFDVLHEQLDITIIIIIILLLLLLLLCYLINRRTWWKAMLCVACKSRHISSYLFSPPKVLSLAGETKAAQMDALAGYAK